MFAPNLVSAFGLGVDLYGAWLLALGVFMSPPELWQQRVRPRNDRLDTLAALCDGRATGQLGVWFLGFGFVAQAAGYFLATGLEPSTQGSWRFAYLTVVLLLLGAGIAAFIEATTSTRLLKRSMITVARVDQGKTLRARRLRHAKGLMHRLPDAYVLKCLGIEAGWPDHPNEPDVAYARRVFDVEAEDRGRSITLN